MIPHLGVHRLTDKELLARLKEQQLFLGSEVAEYQRGKAAFALKIAATLRTIFHRTTTSQPLLPDLAERYGCRFTVKGRNIGLTEGLVFYMGFQIGDKTPDFKAPFLIPKRFEEYWQEIVYIEGPVRYTRKQLVLWAANKLGGAHVDPEIPPELTHLVDGGVKLISERFGEEPIINQVVYEMAMQVLIVLKELIPRIEKAML